MKVEGEVVVTEKHRGQVVAEHVEQKPVYAGQPQPGEVYGYTGFRCGVSRNLGDFNNVSVQASLSLPFVVPDPGDLDDALARAEVVHRRCEAWCEKWVNEKLAVYDFVKLSAGGGVITTGPATTDKTDTPVKPVVRRRRKQP